MSVFKVLLCGVLFFLYSGLNAEDFKIVFSKPSKVGEKYHMTGEGESSESMKISSNGQAMNEKKSEIRSSIDGVVEILEINEHKKPSKIKLKLNRIASSDKPGIPQIEMFPADSEIIIEKKGKKTVYLFKGEPLPGPAVKVLSMYISLPRGKTTDDDVFGTKEKKKVGDSWKINSKMAAADMSKDGMKLDEKNITGSSKFEKVVKVGDSRFLQIKNEIAINGIKLPFPPTIEVRKSEMTVTNEGLRELADAPKSYDPRWTKTSMKMEIVYEGAANPQAPPMEIKLEVTQDLQKTIKNLK